MNTQNVCIFKYKWIYDDDFINKYVIVYLLSVNTHTCVFFSSIQRQSSSNVDPMLSFFFFDKRLKICNLIPFSLASQHFSMFSSIVTLLICWSALNFPLGLKTVKIRIDSLDLTKNVFFFLFDYVNKKRRNRRSFEIW